MADDAGRINEVLAETSFLYGGNAAFVEDLYARWASNPASVEPSWQAFLATLYHTARDLKRAARADARFAALAEVVRREIQQQGEAEMMQKTREQMKDELDPSPPVLVLLGRADDRWLAEWSRADAVATLPVDPIALAEAFVEMVEKRRTA